jgi:hypothetical protein
MWIDFPLFKISKEIFIFKVAGFASNIAFLYPFPAEMVIQQRMKETTSSIAICFVEVGSKIPNYSNVDI